MQLVHLQYICSLWHTFYLSVHLSFLSHSLIKCIPHECTEQNRFTFIFISRLSHIWFSCIYYLCVHILSRVHVRQPTHMDYRVSCGRVIKIMNKCDWIMLWNWIILLGIPLHLINFTGFHVGKKEIHEMSCMGCYTAI